MRILGVDPGTLITGYGVIDHENGRLSLVDYGIIQMRSADTLPRRLEKIYTGLETVIAKTAPDEFAIESAFYSKNVQSTLKLGHARGVAILAAVLRQIPTAEYAPREVEQAVTGNGAATKEQVEYMVMAMLKMESNAHLLDATDALAVAICHSTRALRPQRGGRRRGEGVEDGPRRSAGVLRRTRQGRGGLQGARSLTTAHRQTGDPRLVDIGSPSGAVSVGQRVPRLQHEASASVVQENFAAGTAQLAEHTINVIAQFAFEVNRHNEETENGITPRVDHLAKNSKYSA